MIASGKSYSTEILEDKVEIDSWKINQIKDMENRRELIKKCRVSFQEGQHLTNGNLETK